MTANQLAFQRNMLAQEELAEQRRANLVSESQRARELGQREREMLSKYGPFQYYSENEDASGPKAVFNMIRRGFEYAFNPILSILSGSGGK